MGCKICRLNCDSSGISHSKYRSEHALLRSQKRQKKVPYHFHQVIDDASILDFKVANGIVRVKTVPGNTMTIEGNCRVAAQDEEFFDAEGFVRDRVKVGVDDDKIVIKSVSKRVYCDWTISLPQKCMIMLPSKG